MDIEGAETEVIMDCKDQLNKVENIMVEYHAWQHKPQELEKILGVLKENNFRYYLLTVNPKKQPFITSGRRRIDFQANVFGYKNNIS
jgi:hypothetical protein